MLSGIRIWNYNKSEDDTKRGVKLINVVADKILLTPEKGILVRKAYGICNVDYSQFI